MCKVSNIYFKIWRYYENVYVLFDQPSYVWDTSSKCYATGFENVYFHILKYMAMYCIADTCNALFSCRVLADQVLKFLGDAGMYANDL